MHFTIYHNPRCSKSRQTLELLRERGVEPSVITYLQTPPSADEILALAKALSVGVKDLLRTGEADYKASRDELDDADPAAIARWLAAHPKVLQRPIVVDERRAVAVIGRPPENVLRMLDA